MDGGGYVVRISEDRIRLPSERLDDLRERAGPHPATPGPWRRLGARHAGRLAARPVGEYGVLGWHDGSPAFMVAQVFCSPRCSRGSVCRAPRRIALRTPMSFWTLRRPYIESGRTNRRTHGTSCCALRGHRQRPAEASRVLHAPVRMGVSDALAGRPRGLGPRELWVLGPRHVERWDGHPGWRGG